MSADRFMIGRLALDPLRESVKPRFRSSPSRLHRTFVRLALETCLHIPFDCCGYVLITLMCGDGNMPASSGWVPSRASSGRQCDVSLPTTTAPTSDLFLPFSFRLAHRWLWATNPAWKHFGVVTILGLQLSRSSLHPAKARCSLMPPWTVASEVRCHQTALPSRPCHAPAPLRVPHQPPATRRSKRALLLPAQLSNQFH